MPRQPVTEAEFAALTSALATEIQSANIDYRLYHSLADALELHEPVYRQSRTFWGLTLDAHLNSAVLRICRVYDQQKASVSLEYWLKIIKNHHRWFTREKFEARRTTSLTQYHGAPIEAEVNADIADCSVTHNPLVKNLVIYRNSLVGHLGENYILRRRGARELFRLTWGEVGRLIEDSLRLVNKYTALYNGHSYSPNMVGADDFKYIIEKISAALRQSQDEDLARLLKQTVPRQTGK